MGERREGDKSLKGRKGMEDGETKEMNHIKLQHALPFGFT
jgi:hypothetical protein